MPKTYKTCQSCAMPFKYDPQGGGTEEDGTKSVMYCSYCYQDGKGNARLLHHENGRNEVSKNHCLAFHARDTEIGTMENSG